MPVIDGRNFDENDPEYKRRLFCKRKRYASSLPYARGAFPQCYPYWYGTPGPTSIEDGPAPWQEAWQPDRSEQLKRAREGRPQGPDDLNYVGPQQYFRDEVATPSGVQPIRSKYQNTRREGETPNYGSFQEILDEAASKGGRVREKTPPVYELQGAVIPRPGVGTIPNAEATTFGDWVRGHWFVSLIIAAIGAYLIYLYWQARKKKKPSSTALAAPKRPVGRPRKYPRTPVPPEEIEFEVIKPGKA